MEHSDNDKGEERGGSEGGYANRTSGGRFPWIAYRTRARSTQQPSSQVPGKRGMRSQFLGIHQVRSESGGKDGINLRFELRSEPWYAVTTIAVVDDDQTLLELVAELFRERNWIMVAVRDSSTAVESIREARPDAVLLDVRLGGERSGWDILEHLTDEPETDSIPVIIWSGDSRALEEKRSWLHDQHIPALSKPFEIDDLYEYLDAALHKH